MQIRWLALRLFFRFDKIIPALSNEINIAVHLNYDTIIYYTSKLKCSPPFSNDSLSDSPISDGVRRTVCFCPSLKNDFHISVFSTSLAKIKPLSTTIIATIRKANSLCTGQEISNIAICGHGNTSSLPGIGVGDNLHSELSIFHCLFIRAFP